MVESPPSTAGPASRTSLLRGNPAFRSLCASRAVSFIGDGIATTALVLLVAPRDGPAGVGVLLLANALPKLGGPLAGVLADRVQTRRLLIGCDLASALVIGLIAVALPPLPVLIALVAVAGALATIRNPAGRSLAPVLAVVVAAQLIAGAGNAVENIGYDAIVQDVVPRPFLGRVFGTVGTAAQLGAAFAYTAGSFLVGLVGARATFVVAGVGTLAVLLLLVLGRQPRGDTPVTLRFTRRNWCTIRDDTERFRAMGVRVWRSPFA